jgi:hypothetical protein
MKILPLLFLVLLFLTSCPDARRYNTGYFQEEVVNFSDVNSAYDDYNMDAPFIYNHTLFHFSSNRNSLGGNFDIVGAKMFIDWSKTEGTLSIGTDFDVDWFDFLLPLFDSANTSCNEMGPYTLGYHEGNNYYIWKGFLLYASDCGGDFDIRFLACERSDSSTPGVTKIKSSREINFFNTEADELYPSFYGSGYYNANDYGGNDPGLIERILFCSDRNGSFDIFEIVLPDSIDMNRILDAEFEIEPGSMTVSPLALNSDGDDKCPYANGKLLVFSSNREGGYGGFDLYYSLFSDGSWSEPVNFGEKINSSYDEYRPVTLYHPEFANSLLIFSSNRPGGKGGFDLYHAGIAQMIW